MTSIYKIASDTVKAPSRQEWDSHDPLDLAHNGAPLYSSKRKCTLTFTAMAQSDFDVWQAIDDGATHSVTIYSPDFDTPTAYTCYARVVSAGLEVGGVVIGAVIELWYITA